ncbi:hypothetical protein ABIE58_000528 [Roseovarius sp. MBR-78]|uniref:EF-hand domain-containing protein n=1 Tax=Roseovarius sp. MBR-78 TaxID=3156460 RepID=UPI00339882CB
MKHTGLMAGLALAIALGGLSEARAQMQGEGQTGGMGAGGMGSGMHGMAGGDMATRFAEADADGDGKVSRDEMVARMTAQATERVEARADRMIAHHDADGDKMLTLEEMQSGMGGRMFGRLDADGDGMISREEFAKIREMHQMQGRGQGGHHGAGQGGKHGGKHGGQYGGQQGRMSHHGMGMGEGGVVIHNHYYQN